MNQSVRKLRLCVCASIAHYMQNDTSTQPTGTQAAFCVHKTLILKGSYIDNLLHCWHNVYKLADELSSSTCDCHYTGKALIRSIGRWISLKYGNDNDPL